MKLEQVTLDDLLPEESAGTAGKHPKFIQLGPTKAFLLRQLSRHGAMTSSELVAVAWPRWSKSGITGRLSELTRPDLRLVEARYAPGGRLLMYAITPLGRRALRGEPLE